jgi:hypothetical protein
MANEGIDLPRPRLRLVEPAAPPPPAANPSRSAFRVAVRCPVSVEREYGRGVLECATANLSVIGALLDRRANALEQAERVRLTITLPTGPVVLAASVVRHEEEDARAVRFDAHPPGTEAALAHYLTDVQRRDLARRRSGPRRLPDGR